MSPRRKTLLVAARSKPPVTTPEAEKLLSSLKLTSAIFIPNLLKKAIVSRISA